MAVRLKWMRWMRLRNYGDIKRIGRNGAEAIDIDSREWIRNNDSELLSHRINTGNLTEGYLFAHPSVTCS